MLGHGPLEAGLRLLPLTLGALVGAPLTARLVHAVGVRATVTAGLGLSAAGMAAFGQSLDADYAVVAAALAAVGAGVGLALTATSDAILTAAPPERAGAASSVSETAYELGTGLGIALLGSLLGALYADGLPASGLSAPARDSLAGAVEAARALPGEAGAALLERATGAFVDALTTTSWVSAGLLAAAAAVAWALLGRTARGPRAAVAAHA